jgi:hypothetical protein
VCKCPIGAGHEYNECADLSDVTEYSSSYPAVTSLNDLPGGRD